MSVTYYDAAISSKINSWIKDPNMVVLKPDESTRLFSIKADQGRDQLTLPLIAISRSSDVELEFPHKNTMSDDGVMLRSQVPLNSYLGQKIINHAENYRGFKIEKGDTLAYITYQLNAIPMKLSYQLDIYTRYADEGNEYLRNFIFNLVNHPKLTIELPYNDIMLTHNANIDVLSTVSDNSDVDQHLFPDQFTRWTIQLEIRDAYLFSIPKKVNLDAIVEDVVVDTDK